MQVWMLERGLSAVVAAYLAIGFVMATFGEVWLILTPAAGLLALSFKKKNEKKLYRVFSSLFVLFSYFLVAGLIALGICMWIFEVR